MKHSFIAIALLAIATMLSSCENNSKTSTADLNDTARFKGKSLNILCWEGYADPAFTKAFEDKYGVTVKGTYFGSSDELVSKLQSGGDASYDIISPSSDVASYLVDAGLVQPLDVSKLQHWNDLSPELKNLKDVVRDNNVYGLPFCWG